MGLEPYYTIADHTGSYLELRSRPGANAPAGRVFMGCGGALLLLSIAIFCMSFSSSRESFGAFFSGMLLSWPCGVVGGLILIGGTAIAKIQNTIKVDTATRTITYLQKARRERQQTLDFDQIAEIRMSKQLFTPPGVFRQKRPVVVLEFVTDEGNVWLIDSAVESQSLVPLALAFAEIVQLDISWNLQDEPPPDKAQMDRDSRSSPSEQRT